MCMCAPPAAVNLVANGPLTKCARKKRATKLAPHSMAWQDSQLKAKCCSCKKKTMPHTNTQTFYVNENFVYSLLLLLLLPAAPTAAKHFRFIAHAPRVR
ncbi:unnamed protein product [Ceratitis capitata]|uniref:(Mediterranean fruit fly) hypothetical protein n=1 Tax=Ceratitis capitata TaxID=7213 RepID=A0A811VEJ0_CERCA|nr:unnamed protein product [Ceratitis capitata]